MEGRVQYKVGSIRFTINQLIRLHAIIINLIQAINEFMTFCNANCFILNGY